MAAKSGQPLEGNPLSTLLTPTYDLPGCMATMIQQSHPIPLSRPLKVLEDRHNNIEPPNLKKNSNESLQPPQARAHPALPWQLK